MKTETWKTLRGSGWRGGAVLAAWPTVKQLGVIADDWRTDEGLCVVSWNEDDVRPWAAAAHPEILSPGTEPAVVPQLDPVVKEGMKTMTLLVNPNNHLAGSFDRQVAVAILLTLHDARYPLPPEQLYAWGLANNWPARAHVKDASKRHGCRVHGPGAPPGSQGRVRSCPARS